MSPKPLLPNDLCRWLPEGVTETIVRWLSPHSVRLVLKGPRSSIAGDFRAPRRGQVATITVNTDLPPYQFLVTLTHEIAHLKAWEKYATSIKPHGPQWKAVFAELLRELAQLSALPTVLRGALRRHALKPTSATFRDAFLIDVIRRLDGDQRISLADIPVGHRFRFRDRLFTKLANARTRSRCRDIETGADYLIAMVAPVEPIRGRS
ncbi:MAG: SprT-like domain-containing protein [Bradymonadia bacterium]